MVYHPSFHVLKISYLQERNTLVYPSVTVCKKYTFDHYIDDIFLNKSFSLEEVVETANKLSWDVEAWLYILFTYGFYHKFYTE